MKYANVSESVANVLKYTHDGKESSDTGKKTI